jgi:hypothetical protein
MSYPRTFTSKKYPKFIRTSRYLISNSKIDKIFPYIGLPDVVSKCPKITAPSIHEIGQKFVAFLNRWLSHLENNGCLIRLKRECHFQLLELKGLVINDPTCLLSKTKKLIVPVEVVNLDASHKPFKTGSALTDLISELGNFIDQWHSAYDLPETIAIYDAITRYYLAPLKNLSIVFSAANKNAAWDMATISMRGIKSCQAWRKTRYSKRLIGSILDPCAGVIYLTDGKKTKYGSRMLGRMVVRFIIYAERSDKGGYEYKPALYLERAYAGYPFLEDGFYVGKFFEEMFRLKFQNDLTAISSQMPIFSPDFLPLDRVFIPKSKKEIPESLMSYRDSGWIYNQLGFHTATLLLNKAIINPANKKTVMNLFVA